MSSAPCTWLAFILLPDEVPSEDGSCDKVMSDLVWSSWNDLCGPVHCTFHGICLVIKPESQPREVSMDWPSDTGRGATHIRLLIFIKLGVGTVVKILTCLRR
jgi:hypothetical protein